MLITNTSMLSGITRTLNIPVTREQIATWQSGVNIQDAMPEVPVELREFIMTGITAEEWAQLEDLEL